MIFFDIFLINLGEFSPEIKYACHRYVGYINEDVMSCILLQYSWINPFCRKTIPVDMCVWCVCVYVSVKLNKWIQCFMLEQMTDNSQYIVIWGRAWGWGKYWGRECCFANMKTYKAKVIKRVWCWHLDRQRKEWKSHGNMIYIHMIMMVLQITGEGYCH